MTQPLSDRAASVLSRYTDRRGFLVRAALVGSALVAAPLQYVLRPGTAEAAVCSCAGRSCPCGSTCCDGYTEFCCTVTGVNRCPEGSVLGGWWKASGSGFCDVSGVPKPRYYLDCNADCHGCGCGSSGICASGCADCTCRCGNGKCTNRKTCCTRFRYGQCNQQLKCVGPIVCRVVTCTPPWKWAPNCTATVAVDNNTRFHHRACLEPAALPAVRRGTTWTLARETFTGASTFSFPFGGPDDIPVMGDWTKSGARTVGVFREGEWRLRTKNSAGAPQIVFPFGKAGDLPVVGDWNGDGRETVGVVRARGLEPPVPDPLDPLGDPVDPDGPPRLEWRLRLLNKAGPADRVFDFGLPGDVPVVGDWNGDGVAGIGVVRGNRWIIRNQANGGPPDNEFVWGHSGDIPVVGDWNGSGRDRPGLVRGDLWLCRTKLAEGPADIRFKLGTEGDVPLVWRRAPG